MESPGLAPGLLIAHVSIDRSFAHAHSQSTALHIDPAWGRDHGVTGPCARPPHRSCTVRTLACTSVRAHARSHPMARRGWLPRLNQNVSRPVALLPGSSRPAASGARIVPWRQPGKWLIKCPFASTECLRASPTQCQCSKPPGRRCGLGSDWHGRSRSARWRTAGRAGARPGGVERFRRRSGRDMGRSRYGPI